MLYALPDKRSIPQPVSNNVEELSNLHDFIEGQLNADLSRLKSQNFVREFCNRFSEDSRSSKPAKTQENSHISHFPESEKTALRFG